MTTPQDEVKVQQESAVRIAKSQESAVRIESITHKLSEPFIGPRSFTVREKDIFFGRDGETQKIVSLILSNQEILIYAQSGAGKTSIINAKVLPELETYEMELLPTARVGGTVEHGALPTHIKNIYIYNTLQYLNLGKEQTLQATDNLIEFLAKYPRKRNANNREVPRIIIFDQFEELFTTYVQGWPEQREAFFLQLRHAINADALLKVVFVIREDHLAQLEKYCSILPDRLRIRFHLELLRRNAAISAIEGPLTQFDRAEVGNQVADKIVDDLLKTQVEDVFGDIIETTGEYVEPVHLQVVCQRLWRRGLPADKKSISQTAVGNVDEALEEFYIDAITTAAAKTEINEGIIREWCEKNLITSSGTRGIIHRERDETGGIPNTTIDILEQKYLIRREQRAGATWYELTHDRLLKPIRESNKKWEEKKKTKVTVRRYFGRIVSIERFADDLVSYLKGENFKVGVSKIYKGHPIFISVKKSSMFRKIIGSDRSAVITISGDPDNFEVSVAIDTWKKVKNVISSVLVSLPVGIFFSFIPSAIAAGISIYYNKEFDHHLWEIMENKILDLQGSGS